VCGGAFAVEIPIDDCHWLQLENEDGLPCRGRKSRPYNAFGCALASKNVKMPASIIQASAVVMILITGDVSS
jgi:hypothetical protein